ncbi:MAG TPA: Ig-like domain-containing protein, partial [Candidatus Limnocylindrales bacterium]|nr:Ig-like domain-containing protein [Candidatus Limnocylindrales bacterium]
VAVRLDEPIDASSWEAQGLIVQSASGSPVPGARVPGLRPVVAVRFDEAIDAASWEARGLIVQAGSGASVAGALRYDTATRTGLWVPLVDLAAGATYALTVGPVQDEAGNRIATGDSWTLTPLSPTVLGVVPARSVLRLGEGTSLAVRLEPAATGAVVAEARRADETAYAPLGSIELSAAGLAALEVSPAANTYYRFSYPGTATAASATGEIRVLVRRDVRLAGLDPSVTRRIRPGTTVSLTAEVAPRTGGVRLSFRLYRLDPATGRYRYAGSFGRVTNSDGRASLAWTPTRSGNYYWRVAVLPTVDYANNVSAVHRWRVTG